MQVDSTNWIKIIDNFLTEDECLELIDSVKDKLSAASVLGQEIDGYRVATTSWINNKTPLVNKIQTFLSKETNLPIENQEEIHIVKYDIGGQYKNHQDFFHPDEDYYEEEMKYGGQRVFTCLIYLNEDFIGGDTHFPNKKFMVNPKTGRLIIWRNLTEDNLLDYDSLHAGLPVDIGEKLIALVWVRENKFK
jgi:prolyl 4-hydroxylase